MAEPNIRFRKANGSTYPDWEEKHLGDVASRVTRKNKNNETDIPLTIASIEGLVDQRTYFGKTIASKDMSGYYLLKKGEFAYNKSYSNGYDYGSIKRLDNYDMGALSTLYICFALNAGENSDFFNCYFNGLSWYNQMKEICAEGARNHGLLNVSTNDFFNITLSIPSSNEERQRIADFFEQIDTLIATSEQEVNKLQELKKGCLQKMFPKDDASVPEVRFPGYTDAWEQRKLSELATMHARIGWQNLRTSEFLDDGDYLLITGTDFEDGRINFSTCHYVEKERYDQDKHIQISDGSILITKDGTLGKVAYVQGLQKPATLNAGVFNVEIKDENEVDGKYLFQYLKAPFLMDYVGQKATGGTIKHLNQNILVDFPVVMPKKAEQEKIGQYFENIDNLITLHQRECEKYKELKRGLLQQMFV